jgi:DNA repair ATPase RecN
MTGDEVERSIEFLLKHQATLETQVERTSLQVEKTAQRLEETNVRLEETNQRLEETNQRIEMIAETQREFIQVVTRHIEAQGEINASLRGMVRELSTSMQSAVRELSTAQKRTDARLDRLAETVERFITEGRNGKS